MDKQITEVLGRNCLVEILLREGVDVAIPVRDKGIDLMAYFCIGTQCSRCVAVPIQIKAASKESFVLDKKYAKFPGLLLAYVWHVSDGQENEIFLMTYTDALKILHHRGHACTKSWREDGKYSITNPSPQLRDALVPFKIGRGQLRKRLERDLSVAHTEIP